MISGGSMDTIVMMIKNNCEITYSTSTELFTVKDKLFSEVICITKYPLIAKTSLDVYSNEYET